MHVSVPHYIGERKTLSTVDK